MKQNLYFEDVVIGTELETSARTVSRKDILTFAEITYDHHPLHTDDAFSREMGFDGIIAHGLYGLSLMQGLQSELKLYDTTSIGSLGWNNVRFTKPLMPDDEVHVRVKFTSKRESRKPDRGVVTESFELINQHAETITEAEHVTLLKRKPAGAES